jgi:CRP-like cAMP-binding protein
VTGREVTFRDLGLGESSGEIAAIDGGPRSANVIALLPATVSVLEHAGFTDMLRAEPQMVDNLLTTLAGLVRVLSQRVFEFSLPVAARVVHELLRLCAQAGGHDGRVVLSPPPRHADIASRTNTHREALSRTLAQLQREGLLVRRPGALVVEDVARLQRWLEERAASDD